MTPLPREKPTLTGWWGLPTTMPGVLARASQIQRQLRCLIQEAACRVRNEQLADRASARRVAAHETSALADCVLWLLAGNDARRSGAGAKSLRNCGGGVFRRNHDGPRNRPRFAQR